MIEMTLTELAGLAIGTAMVLVVLFSWISRWSASNAERRSVRNRVVCRLCLAVFEASGRDTVQTCPECHARTDRRGPRPLG